MRKTAVTGRGVGATSGASGAVDLFPFDFENFRATLEREAAM
jgi:hypothetical protein